MGKRSPTPKPPTYVPPSPYQPPPNPQSTVPPVQNGQQIMGIGAGIEKMLPQWLQLNNSPMDPAGMQQYEQNYYQQNVAPGLAQLQSNLFNNGQAYGSYAGAMAGQQAAQGNFDTYQAGLNYAQQLFGDQVAGRQSYFSGGPALAQQQNSADVSRGLGIAGLQSQNAGMQNNYNLSANGQLNGFNQQNYGNQFQNMQYQNYLGSQRLGGILGGGLGLANLFSNPIGQFGSGLGSGMFGGSGGGYNPNTTYPNPSSSSGALPFA